MQRLATLLQRARGRESRVHFARRLGLSYTFVRAMELGTRFPSDKVLLDIAQRLELDQDDLLVATWCDRSPDLERVLLSRGVDLPPSDQASVSDGLENGNKTLRARPRPRRTAVQRQRAVS